MKDIFYIGGSPCSGKSTVAEELAKRYDLHYFKVDDHLDRYAKLGAEKKKEICSKVEAMSPEQIWMRNPIVQCEEELLVYGEMFEFIMEDLKQIDCKKGIITEGAAYLPKLMKQFGISKEQYVSITPTREFQIYHYSKREWVPYILAECSDKEKAFSNWMERDVLFAEDVRKQCRELGYVSMVNNGECPVEEMIGRVVSHFNLEV